MSFIAQVTRSLFPQEARQPARRRAGATSGLTQLSALVCALIPLAAMLHAMSLTA